MYHQHPEGQFHLELCTNISCHLAGADQLVAHVKKSLGIDVGAQTEDAAFSLMEAECLASCGSGPMLKVGEDYYEYLTIPACDALIKKLREMAPSLNGKHYEHGPNGPHVGAVPGFEPADLGSPRVDHGSDSGTPTPSAEPASATPEPAATEPAATEPSGAALPSFDPPPLKKKDKEGDA
jgi:hypothetical protein